ETRGGAGITQFSNPLVPITNPFIPDDLHALLATRADPDAPFAITGRFAGPMGKRHFPVTFKTAQLIAGLRGELPFEQWTWDAYVSNDRSNRIEKHVNSVLNSRVQTLLNAPDGGASICSGGYNPFGLANSLSVSTECQQYLSVTALKTTDLSQDII